ncbi:hypothetical protein CSA56_11925 [candidate division KSB3 bacterium]|uniref:GyrI-like small molecule binding domain-containing protein n=1 Tax=candidate division KSB3 bacterium TaxID=2044937 RepID=A0A2G6KCJ8_9BACT|nr:MAG: hypothetical protein CSA56_11925 [candidate division KSB3 bacterium]
MSKIDYKKELKHLYKPSAKKIEIVNVPSMNFLMIDGAGDPNTSQEFQEGIEALFGVSYTLKFMIKKGAFAVDYGVLPLEGLWWADDMGQFSIQDKSNWQWTVMTMQPEQYITVNLVQEAIVQVDKKKGLAALSKLRFERFEEGLAAQVMHIGPFSEEGPTIEKLHDFIEEQGYQRSGRHHEIYLSDFRRTAPEKLKTIIRQPMRKV